MPKITIARESLESSGNSTILNFLNRNKRNRIFRLNTAQRAPAEFGIKESFREERITDKGYLELPFSEYHTPTYKRSDIEELLKGADIVIPDRKVLSTILPLSIDMNDVTPEQLTELFETLNQQKADLAQKINTHRTNQSELETQEAELTRREKELDLREQNLNAEQTKIDLEKAENIQNKFDLENREKTLQSNLEKSSRAEKAANAYFDKIRKEMADLETMKNLEKSSNKNRENQLEEVQAEPIGQKTEVNDSYVSEIGQNDKTEPEKSGNSESQTKVSEDKTVSGNAITKNLNPEPQGQPKPVQTLSNTADLETDNTGIDKRIQEVISNFYKTRGEPGSSLRNESFNRVEMRNAPDLGTIDHLSPSQVPNSHYLDRPLSQAGQPSALLGHHARPMSHDQIRSDNFHNNSIPTPLLTDESVRNIDDFIEAITALKVYFKSEASLILSILIKSKKLEIIPLLSNAEKESVQEFSKFLRKFYNTSDYYSLRAKYESLVQTENENCNVYLRKVMRLYYLSKSLEPPSDLSGVLNTAIQKDITYKFLKTLKNSTLRKELTLRDPNWLELPALSSKLEDIYKRLENESVSVVANTPEESVNKITDACYECGSRSHFARDCRASRKDKRSFNRKERRRSMSRGRSRERFYRKSPFPSRNSSIRRSKSNSRDKYRQARSQSHSPYRSSKSPYRYRSRSHSQYRSSKSPYRYRNRSQSSPRRDKYYDGSSSKRSYSPREDKYRSSSRDEYRQSSRSPKRYGSKDRSERKVKFVTK